MIMQSIQFNVTISALDTDNLKLGIDNSIKTTAIFSVATLNVAK